MIYETNRQLEAKNIMMKEGRLNIIDKVNGAAREGSLGYAIPVEVAQSYSDKGKDGKQKKRSRRGLAC